MIGGVGGEVAGGGDARMDADRCGDGGDNFVVVVVVFGGHGKRFLDGWIDAFAPECEAPICESAVVVIHDGVFDYNRPFANACFAPEVDC